ncbi:zinc-binding dehydrogenase [Acidisoma cellulosilytica]|uniref:Zinc-binding dehydrogenase n=1 Tax=Acidisoma cellulosilyticum TaxID=2802395 RepID=A0A964E6N0_9PROT|nr:zinc-binding dehydrogenase [Acidisoma cellulosilyticum]MCB8883754.1 zinc-binding dehydrogenase [Acidisoma cellulosilyticum]
MAKMLAAFLPGDDKVDLREIDVPEPGIGQVRLRMKASGLCGSDIHYIYHKHIGEGGAKYQGVVAGHEPSGQVETLGPGCRHFKPGDRVSVYHISGCGFCRSCRKGYQISCTDPLRAAYGWQRDGGHAEYLIADEKDLVKLPDSLTYEDGCFISCGVGTAYEGILRGEVSGSDSVMVVGLGPVGLAALMLAQGRGAKMTIGVDTQVERVEVAQRLGLITHGFVAGPDTLGAVQEVTRGGANVTLDCSGNARGRLLALQATHIWGRCVYIGETGEVTFKVSDDLMHKQRRIIGSWVTSLHNMDQCAEDLADWKRYPRDIITDRFSLAQAAEAYALTASGRAGKVIIRMED